MGEDLSRGGRLFRRGALVACAALPLVLGLIAFSAARTKSATMDEPLHAVGAWLHVFHHDFRINPEDPPLWNHVAMLAHARDSLAVDFADPDWSRSLQATDYQTRFTTRTLYQTAANDGIAFVQRARAMMALLGVALGWLIALVAWKFGGPVAALVAVTLYSFDPNFTAHAPLVKNDVPISLALLGVVMALRSVLHRAMWWNVPLLGLLCGAALATKFSGVIVVLLVGIVLLQPWFFRQWRVLKWDLRSIPRQVLAAGAVYLTCGLISWCVIWAAYGFRYDPTLIPGSRLDLPFQIKAAIQNEFFLRHGRFADEQEYRDWPVPLPVRLAMFSERWQLLPHAYVHGFVYTYQTSLVRSAYLMGQVSPTGWWYYFPLAMLLKTPLATLVGIGALVGTAVWVLVTRARGTTLVGGDRWGEGVLILAATAYASAALVSNLNLGIRHVLPLYPLLFILIGLAVARLARRRPRTTVLVAAVLAAGLVVESLASYPHYIPFFNAIARPHRLHLLSDSNLDWGQDLPLLARWRRENPQGVLSLCYFGSVDPASYGIDDYVNLPPGFWLGPPYRRPVAPGVIAISATYLQGVHMPRPMGDYYAELRAQRPRAILGGSIYLYDYPPSPPSSPSSPSSP